MIAHLPVLNVNITYGNVETLLQKQRVLTDIQMQKVTVPLNCGASEQIFNIELTYILGHDFPNNGI